MNIHVCKSVPIEFIQVVKVYLKLKTLKQTHPKLFYHWQMGLILHIKNNKSRMTGDCHVRFCERFRGETPLYLLGG